MAMLLGIAIFTLSVPIEQTIIYAKPHEIVDTRVPDLIFDGLNSCKSNLGGSRVGETLQELSEGCQVFNMLAYYQFMCMYAAVDGIEDYSGDGNAYFKEFTMQAIVAEGSDLADCIDSAGYMGLVSCPNVDICKGKKLRKRVRELQQMLDNANTEKQLEQMKKIRASIADLQLHYTKALKQEFEKLPAFDEVKASSQYNDTMAKLCYDVTFAASTLNTLKDMNAYLSADDHHYCDLADSNPDFGLNVNGAVAYSKLSNLNTKYKDYIDYASSLVNVVDFTNAIAYDPSLDLVENLCTAHVKETDQGLRIEFQEGYASTLTNNWIALFSGSAIYEPFNSYTGDYTFINSIAKIAPDQESLSALKIIYNSTKSLKKPLYSRELREDGTITGTAELLSIGSFRDKLMNGTSTAFCTVYGQFTTDASGWIYQPEWFDTSVDTNAAASMVESEEVTSGNASEGEKDTYTSYGAISASKTISDELRLGQPLAMFSNSYNRAVDNLSFAVFYNIFNTWYRDKSDMDSELLYMNMYGDIVTADDLVIIPAAANPVFYNVENYGYNIYTVAFQNSYPYPTSMGTDFKVPVSEDTKKYIFGLSNDSTADVIAGYNSGSQDSTVYAYYVDSKVTMDDAKDMTVGKLQTQFFYNSGMSTRLYSMVLKKLTKTTKGSVDSYVLTMSGKPSIAAVSIFPYYKDTDREVKAAKAIVQNMFYYLTHTEDGKAMEVCDKLNSNYIMHYVLVQNYEGSAFCKTYSENFTSTYSNFIEDGYNRFFTQVKEISESLAGSVGSMKRLLGFPSVLSMRWLGKIVGWMAINYVFVIFLTILIVTLLCIRLRKGMFAITINSVLTFLVLALFVFAMPIALPSMFNMMVNTSSDNSVMRYYLNKIENGETDYNGSISLYRYSYDEAQRSLELMNTNIMNQYGGDYIIVNDETGLIMQDNCLRISAKDLFNSLVVDVNFTANQVHCKKINSNNIDYYIPYYQIADAIADKLTKTAELEQQILMKRSDSKKSYLFCDYIYSDAFVNPGDYSNLRDIEGVNNDTLEEDMQELFGQNVDWLGLTDLFVEQAPNDEAMKNTLWFMIMLQNGYYYISEETGEVMINEPAMGNLISYINNQTRQFIFTHEEFIDSFSDQALVPVIALKATTCFTQHASEWGNWLYPLTLNYSELSIDDVMSSIYSTSTAVDAKSKKLSAVETIAEKGSWIDLITLDLCYLVMFASSLLNTVAFYVIYALILFIFFLNLFMDKDNKMALKGLIKCCIILALALLFARVSIMIASLSISTLLSMLIISVLCGISVYLYAMVISSIAFSLTDFGNSKIDAKISGIGNKFNKMRAPEFNVSTTNINQHVVHEDIQEDNYLSQYAFDADLERASGIIEAPKEPDVDSLDDYKF